MTKKPYPLVNKVWTGAVKHAKSGRKNTKFLAIILSFIFRTGLDVRIVIQMMIEVKVYKFLLTVLK